MKLIAKRSYTEKCNEAYCIPVFHNADGLFLSFVAVEQCHVYLHVHIDRGYTLSAPQTK